MAESPGITGEMIRAERKRRGLTQAEAAREVGVAPNTWARWERDLHPPKAGLHRKAVERWIQKENR